LGEIGNIGQRVLEIQRVSEMRAVQGKGTKTWK